MKLGILFAGQGSQYVGMGKDFYKNSQEFRNIFDHLYEKEKDIAFEGPIEELTKTQITQPVMVAFAAGITAELKNILGQKLYESSVTAGLSLGEYSALNYAGVLKAEEAIDLVRVRGYAMADAAKDIECAMSAVLNLSREDLEECCHKASSDEGICQIANYNCPGQIVIAGEKNAVKRAEALAMEAGARRCMPLAVSGPFHTSYMEPAGQVLEGEFENIQFENPNCQVIFNVIGREKNEDEKVGDLLIKQVSGSVYFEDSILEMEKMGVDTIIEIGPGKALSGFVRKTIKEMKIYNLQTWEDLLVIKKEFEGAI
ncbi:MAG: ACP S-malonyltransferase [Eubacterium sp.]|nr:ACP S-malonyltransferase [Eubacterium sp.]